MRVAVLETGMGVACVPMFNNRHTNMKLTENYVKLNVSPIVRLMVLFHEARHAEFDNDFWPHTQCPAPFTDAAGNPRRSLWTQEPLAGEDACDATEFGAYAVTAVMFKNIQRFCTTCTDADRARAGRYADDQSERVTTPDARRRLLADLRSAPTYSPVARF